MRFQYFELLMLFANQLCYLAISNRPLVQVQYCFKPTDTIRPIRDEEPRTATSTFTQVLSSECLSSSSVLLYVHRDRKDC